MQILKNVGKVDMKAKELLTDERGHAYGAVLGLGPDLELCGGYDSVINLSDAGDEWALSRAEAVLVADEMIRRWTEFRKACGGV